MTLSRLTLIEIVSNLFFFSFSFFLFLFLFIVGLVLAFFLTMVPYRIAKVITSLNPDAMWCCSIRQMEIVYLLIKIFPIVSTIVCYVASENFRKGFQVCINLL